MFESKLRALCAVLVHTCESYRCKGQISLKLLQRCGRRAHGRPSAVLLAAHLSTRRCRCPPGPSNAATIYNHHDTLCDVFQPCRTARGVRPGFMQLAASTQRTGATAGARRVQHTAMHVKAPPTRQRDVVARFCPVCVGTMLLSAAPSIATVGGSLAAAAAAKMVLTGAGRNTASAAPEQPPARGNGDLLDDDAASTTAGPEMPLGGTAPGQDAP